MLRYCVGNREWANEKKQNIHFTCYGLRHYVCNVYFITKYMLLYSFVIDYFLSSCTRSAINKLTLNFTATTCCKQSYQTAYRTLI